LGHGGRLAGVHNVPLSGEVESLTFPQGDGRLSSQTIDALSRPLRSLRLSVTDRCNLRCSYCMPEEEYAWLERADVLTFEELREVVAAFASLGVERVRITGGEPLVRRELPDLIALLADIPAIQDLALTTNGLLLAGQAVALRGAGLRRVTVSLDTLQPDRFQALTRRTGLEKVLAGIEAAKAVGFEQLKLDTVVIRGVNDDELVPLLAYAKTVGAELRFIEYMDVGGATRWTMEKVVTRAEILRKLSAHLGPIEPLGRTDRAPAERFRLPDGSTFGIIASVSAPFCGSCDRSRVTADGRWFTCLYAKDGLDLRGPLREGASAHSLSQLLAAGWRRRMDRGAEQRLTMRDRGPLAEKPELVSNPHLEMHIRGG
jgi:GTP 3',8-cyclase